MATYAFKFQITSGAAKISKNIVAESLRERVWARVGAEAFMRDHHNPQIRQHTQTVSICNWRDIL